MAVAWLVTALQSDDADVAAHALLRLWRLTQHRVRSSTSRADVAAELVALPAKSWRRLGLLLLASDPQSVRAVVSIALALAVPDSSDGRQDSFVDDTQRLVQHRMWQSDWRQLMMDKLVDCHGRAVIAQADGTAVSTSRGDGGVLLQLLVVLRAVFVEALRSSIATLRDQARTVDLLGEFALSPFDALACVALQALNAVRRRSPTSTRDVLLDEDVRSHVEASRLFPDLTSWLDTSVSSAVQRVTRKNPAVQPLRRRRHLLVLKVLVDTTQQSAGVALGIIRTQSDHVLGLFLRVAECGHARQDQGDHELLAGVMQLLASLLHYESPQTHELVSKIRLTGVLITVSWLLGHSSPAVQEAAHSLMNLVRRRSPPRDLVRALIEQGCVLIWFTLLSDQPKGDGSSRCRPLLQWITQQVECEDDHLIQAMVHSAWRSTNSKLQRNVILNMLLLSEISTAVCKAVRGDAENPYCLDSVVRDTVDHSSENEAMLAKSLIAGALLFCDRRSTLKLDSAFNPWYRGVSSLRDLSQATEPSRSFTVTIVCTASERIVISSDVLAAHCRFFARELQGLLQNDALSTAHVSFELPAHEAETWRLLVRILPMAPHQAARELERLRRCEVEKLLQLAKAVDCTKCWHAATLALTTTLDRTNWLSTLALATNVGHPALLLRVLRAALASETRPVPNSTSTDDVSGQELNRLALSVWRELLPFAGSVGNR